MAHVKAPTRDLSRLADNASNVQQPVVTQEGVQVVATTLPPATTIIAGTSPSLPGPVTYNLQTGMTFMLQSMDILYNYTLDNRNSDLCQQPCKRDGTDDYCPMASTLSADGCLQSTMALFRAFVSGTNNQPLEGAAAQGWGQAGPCAVNAADPRVNSFQFQQQKNSAMIVSFEAVPESPPGTYYLVLHLTGVEGFDTSLLAAQDSVLGSTGKIYVNMGMPDPQEQIPRCSNCGQNFYYAGTYQLVPSSTPAPWTLSTGRPDYPNSYVLTASVNSVSMQLQLTVQQQSNDEGLPTGICTANGVVGPTYTSAWRFVAAESPSAAQCNLVTSTSCPPGPTTTCLLSETPVGSFMCPACAYAGSCGVDATAPMSATSTPPGWSLCATDPDPFKVASTLTNVCGAVPTSSAACLNGLSDCTKFNEDSGSGMVCRAFCKLQPEACDTAMTSACGVGIDNPSSKLAAILKTPECSCVNLEGSSWPYTGLAKDYTDFTAFITSQGHSIPPAANGQCWWPACTNDASSVLVPSSVKTCPSTTTCISAIKGISVGDDSKVVVDAANKCGWASSAGSQSTTSGKTGSDTPGNTTSAGLGSGSKPWYKTTIFIVIAAVVAVIILILIIALSVKSASSTSSSSRQAQGQPSSVPAMVPAAKPT
jgi:hypothetical protein